MNWSLRYAREMDEETLNRLIPTTSGPIYRDSSSESIQFHTLDKPFGNAKRIHTEFFSNPNNPTIKNYAAFISDINVDPQSTSESKWETKVNDMLHEYHKKHILHFDSGENVHNISNHRRLLGVVKGFLATQD
jgi:hypothetical protein